MRRGEIQKKIHLHNDVLQALANYRGRLLDDKINALKHGTRSEAACMAREYRTVSKLMRIVRHSQEGSYNEQA